MDYGKLAYLKYEDLSREMAEGKKGTPPYNSISIEPADGSFSTQFTSKSLRFKNALKGQITCSANFEITASAALQLILRAYLGGTLLGSRTLSVAIGSTPFTLNFSAFLPEIGENSFSFTITSTDSSNKQIKNIGMRLSGFVEELSGGYRTDIVEDGNITRLVYCDNNLVYSSYFNASGRLMMLNRFKLRGKYTYSSCMTDEVLYDFLYFFTDGGKLFMEFQPYDNYQIPYSRLLIDENVGDICAVRTFNPYGCVLFYIKGGAVYARQLFMDNVIGRVVCGEPQIAAAGGERLFPLYGLKEQCGFILGGGGENKIYYCVGKTSAAPYDTIFCKIGAAFSEET